MPITLKHPDVYAQEVLFPNFVANTGSGTTSVFIGPHYRGPTVPVFVNSWREFQTKFGGFSLLGANGQPVAPSNLALSVYNYFNSGGAQALILRVTASGTGQATPQPAVSAFIRLTDTAATPQNTAQVNAANGGAWGNNIYIDITNHPPVAGTTSGTFDLTVHYGNSSTAAVVEKWLGLSMDPTNPAYALNQINSSNQGSNYISIADLADPTAAPNNEPATVTGVQLTGGLDGAVPTSADLTNAFPLLDTIPGPLVANLPGDSTTGDIGNLIAYAVGRVNQDMFVVIDPPANSSITTVDSYALGLTSSSYGAVYWPWVNIADPIASVTGATRSAPPGGFVMGQYAATDSSRGPWKAPAGLTTQLNTAVSLQLPGGAFFSSAADLDNLATSNVNALRAVPGSGIVIMGARTLSNVLSTQFVNVRRSLIEIRTQLIARSMFALFEDNDVVLWNAVTSVLGQYLNQYWLSGGLAGSTATQAYYVLCDSTNNTPPTVQQGILNVEVGVSPQFPAQYVVISLGLRQGQGTSSAVTQ